MKETALTLLKIAAALYQPIADLLHAVLDHAPPEHASLAEEARARLPERSKTREALDELPAETESRG